MTNPKLQATCIATGLWLAAGSPVSHAQVAAAEDSDTIQAIVVTAQRREERLQDVGMTVVADTGDTLLQKGITDITELSRAVPGLTVSETPYASPVIMLRGVGFYESALAGSSPVAAYIDEIPIPYTRMALAAGLDAQRVEISKGPQGTLYGQNSTGGAINYVTNKPTKEFHAGGDVSFGRFNDLDAQGYISGPLSNTLEARLSVRTHQSSGWQESWTRDATLGAARFTAARLLLDFHPMDDLFFELDVNAFNDRSDTQAVQSILFSPNNPANISPLEASAVLTPLGNDRIADWSPTVPLRRNTYNTMFALKGTYSLNDHLDLMSTTAFSRYRQNQAQDGSGENFEVAVATQVGYITSLSQEFRLQGSAGPLKFVVGTNMSHDNIFESTLYIVENASQAYGIFRIAESHATQHAETYSAFTDFTYTATDALSFDAGIRYTKQDRDFTGCLADPGSDVDGGRWAAFFSGIYGTTIAPGACSTINPATGFIGPVTGSLDQSNVPWRVGVNYKIAPDDLVYLSVSHGFKSGSFPQLGGAVSNQYVPARQESLLAYELGQKVSLFGSRLAIDSAIYYYDYSGKQFRGKVTDPLLGTIEQLFNVPKSNVKGAELQVTARPTRPLTLSANVTYAKTEITSSFATLSPIGEPTNLQGQSFELTPTLAVVGDVTYDVPVASGINGFVSLDESYQSATHGGYGTNPLFRIDPYALMNVSLGVRDAGDKWRAQIWGRNVLDRYYWTNADYIGEYAYRFAGRPATFGVSFSYRY